MLKHLHIRNFAIVESLELDFQQGMSVLSGETGAGKSILLDALGLTLGDRADSNVIRPGAERAEISASFDVTALPAVTAWLGERELEMDGECILRRSIGTDGRSRGYINGQPSPVQALKELGEQLVDIHGQHAHQSLLKRDVQRQLLDAFAGQLPLAKQTASAFRRWQQLRQEFDELSRVSAERDARQDLLRYQVDELKALKLKTGELEELDHEQHRLANVNRLLEGAQSAVTRLYEGEQHSAASLLELTLGELQPLLAFDSALGSCCEMLESAVIQVKEASTELRHYADSLELDPEQLAQVEQRLTAIHDLARKHRVEPAALPALQEQLQQELEQLDNAGSRLQGMQSEIEQLRAEYEKLAGKLRKGRQAAAKKLAEAVSANMQELGMSGGHFDVFLQPLEKGPSANGLEGVELQVSANPGQPLRPLGKVASGGELSRISLAIQVITAGQEGIPTLIFDEVDVGVGGGVAEMVGRQLRRLGENRQVLCVTHQPQVAAQGHHHFRISKQSNGAQTRTEVHPIEAEVRVEEVARMSGGVKITEQTLEHARELIAQASRG
ncbi:MAG: DNA repair protein RecN [Gammaproteobacteria bacterium]|nr:DNA repair protein RecN [Gammaproteobacteria bacterium]